METLKAILMSRCCESIGYQADLDAILSSGRKRNNYSTRDSDSESLTSPIAQFLFWLVFIGTSTSNDDALRR